jgi:cold-inducible RNA-binding protein
MAKKLYVGNLSYGTTDASLKDAFSAFGEVASAQVIIDKMTGRSKGFGFVEMPNDAEADAAIAEMDGRELEGRSVKVNEARPLTDRPPRRDNNRGGFGGGNGMGGGRRQSW